MRTLGEEAEAQGFNLQVTYRDEKTGQVTKTDPYFLRVTKAADGGKGQAWERPAGSGNLFNKQNQPIGRWDSSKPEGERFLAGVPHVAYEKPLTSDQKVAKSIISKDAKINALEAELKSLRAEADKKPAVKVAKDPAKI